MINSQTAKLLRRWIVAGLAAALALAWTITTLVAPSQASDTENAQLAKDFKAVEAGMNFQTQNGEWEIPNPPFSEYWGPQFGRTSVWVSKEQKALYEEAIAASKPWSNDWTVEFSDTGKMHNANYLMVKNPADVYPNGYLTKAPEYTTSSFCVQPGVAIDRSG